MPADILAGQFLQPGVKQVAVVVDFGQVVISNQAGALPGGMPGGARGQLAFFNQHHIAAAFQREVVQQADTHDATTDDYNSGVVFQVGLLPRSGVLEVHSREFKRESKWGHPSVAHSQAGVSIDTLAIRFHYGSILKPRCLAMPNLSIKNVPADVIATMRDRASANQRSLQGELLALVIQAAAGAQTASDLISTPASDGSRGIRSGHKSIEQIAFEHRKHIKRPISKGKSSTELIRQDRDAR